MNIIAAADKNWAIGKDGGLLYRLPRDMKFFRETTTGKTVVMGRKTLESFPGQKPLKNRVNIVLTRNRAYKREDAVICNDMEALCGELKKYPAEDVFVIGGAEIYELLLPMCDRAYITRVDASAEADAFLPDLERGGEWSKVYESEVISDNGTDFRFVTYERVKKHLES